jgi:hypothetical protein
MEKSPNLFGLFIEKIDKKREPPELKHLSKARKREQ